MRGQMIEPEQMSAEQLTGLLKNVLMTDGVTGISNAMGLNGFVQTIQAKGHAERYHVFFLNIKSMRILNEKWGHRGGDQVLQLFAKRLKELTYPDGFAARMGGDNFFAFVNRENRDAFVQGASSVKMQLQLEGDSWTEMVESRMGESCVHAGESASEAMEASNMALQFIRTASDQHLSVYTPEMKAHDFQAKILKDSFQSAIAQEDFLLFYQPKVDIRTGKACGAEALARWNYGGEILSPGLFVPILEQTGAVCGLDFYVLDHMCRDIKKWMNQGITPVKVSCNFSKKHLSKGDFAEKILDIIKSNQVDPQYIEIELTETCDAEDTRVLQKFIGVMQENGISTSIDDFGNAYSSLRLLKQMKAETVKIDKCLIDNVGKGIRENDAITRNIILMLLDLGKEVIVEGVEEECQIDFLKQINCNIVQGFYYAKPMPETEFECWLQ
jgi:diguanylate cyclase (GGDEF)-like protein